MKYILILFLINIFNVVYSHNSLPIEEKVVESRILADTKVDIDTNRNVRVILPISYSSTQKAYPVIYYFHNTFDRYLQIIDEHRIDSTPDRPLHLVAVSN